MSDQEAGCQVQMLWLLLKATFMFCTSALRTSCEASLRKTVVQWYECALAS